MASASQLKVPELKKQLGDLGLSTAGLKADLAARLEAALASGSKRSVPVDLTGDSDDDKPQQPKRAKGGTAEAKQPAWFWAKDTNGGQERIWIQYPAEVAASIEAALASGASKGKVGDKHYVDLSGGGGSGSSSSALSSFAQRRNDNPGLSRPVIRTQDGSPPDQPPLPPPGAAKAGSSAAPASGKAPAAPIQAGMKSIKAGGVVQVRYTSTAGMGGGGVRTEVVKGRAAVDASCPRAADCHVYDDGKSVYNAYLSQTDIAENRNKYYVIQLLATDAAPTEYYCWNKWGRTGEERPSQNALRGPMSLSDAIKDFEKKFMDKTVNEWSKRHAFVRHDKKYHLIERDYGSEPAAAPATAAAGPPKPKATSKLDARVQAFICKIADIQMMERAMREIGFDPAQMPLGKLKESTIRKGYEPLKELSMLLGHSDSTSSSGGASSGGGGSSAGSSGRKAAAASKGRIMELSNTFYSIIPHTSTGDRGTRTTLPPIDNLKLLKEKIEMVESLGSIELASRVLESGTKDDSKVNPVDAKYNSLNSKLTPIDVGSDLHDFLFTYLTNTHAATHNTYTLELEQAFEIERQGEAANFNSSIGNRQLLWHGSRLTNWCGILSNGLRIAPPEAPTTGYMFGKGVYFADMSSKSGNYCFTSREEPVGVLVLCEVALGKQYHRLSAEYEAEKSCRKAKADSTWGLGRTAPAQAGERPLPSDAGITVPMGKGGPNSHLKDGQQTSLLYNEFIVYDISQIQQRYVLQVRFNYK